MKEKKVDRTIKPRTRFLDKAELRLVIEELSHVQHPDYAKQSVRITSVTVADFLTLLLFTGLRRAEASSLKWKDVSLVDRYFVIHDTKNGTDHTVPMSAQVEAMLQRRHDGSDKNATWVFPNKRKTGPLQEPRKQIERLEEIAGVKFSCHDLRRTFATLAEAHGIDHHSIKRALNHKTQDITDRYIQVRAEKMRSTFEAIAQEIVWWVYDEPPSSMLTTKELEGR